jgi:hypothetical protein
MTPVEFEPTISADERPQIRALYGGNWDQRTDDLQTKNFVSFLKMLGKHPDVCITYRSAYIGSLLYVTAIGCNFLSRVSYQRSPLSLPYKISNDTNFRLDAVEIPHTV